MNDITTNKSPMAEFQERVMEKLREDIGAMLPPEVLTEMVRRAVEEQFFKPRIVDTNPGSYSNRKVEKPSWFVQTVTEVAEPLLKQMVTEYVEKNRGVIEQGIRAFLDDQKLLVTTMAIIDGSMKSFMQSQIDGLTAMLNSR